MILSLLYRHSPASCRFIMIDPKMIELSVYDGIPHLLSPVVTDPKKAVSALKWVVREMENRYRAMSKLGVRNVAGYNARLLDARRKGETLTRKVQTGFDSEGKPVFEEQPLDLTPLPFIVVIVDEMADLMLVAGKDVEWAVQRLAQMARAAGIHIVMATQRPSVDVITGTLGKALGGASGGYTSGRREIIALLRQRSRPYLFSNSLAPPIVAASLRVLDMLEQGGDLRERLHENAALFRARMSAAGFRLAGAGHPIVPVMVGDAALASRMAEALLARGVYAVAFSYPVVPKGAARIRVQLSAAHTPAQIEQAVEAFEAAARETGVLPGQG
jgi:hypothetical protein